MQIERIQHSIIRQQLFKGKTILLYGARRTGKTHLVKAIVEEEHGLYLNCEVFQVQDQLSTTNTASLSAVVGHYRLIVLDEIQALKDAGKTLKVLHDTFPQIQFIATGSSSYELIHAVAEPLTGRSRNYILYPISYGELQSALGHTETHAHLESFLRFGTYPEVILRPDEEKKHELQNISTNYLYKDALQYGGMRRPELIYEILKLLAFQIGKEVSLNEISNKTNTNVNTVQRYLYLLEHAYIITSLGGFSRNLRNEIGKSRKYYFLDTGIRNALINNFNTLTLRNDVGQLWENYCVIERIKRNAHHQIYVNAYFWRTYDQKEIDYLEEMDGQLSAFECKWDHQPPKPPKVFMDAYPGSTFQVISRQNVFEFL